MQYLPYKPLSTVWLKAAVMGSLWASFEIIAGSVLHNFRLPFSGTILAFASIFLIIAFIQIWNDKGLVWRAGLICALMKSLSPSAIIIGPMIGIMTEALIIEFFIRITGRNLISYMLGAGMAIVSTLLHQVIKLFILYGFDLVKIFEGIYQYAVRQLRITSIGPAKLLSILVALYLLAGIIAAVMGYIKGRQFKRKTANPGLSNELPLKQENSLFSISGQNRYSLALLFSHLITMIICLWMINSDRIYIYLPISLIYIISCFFWYRNSQRYMKKLSFWLQFIIISLLAAFLLEGYSTGIYFSMAGLIIGLKMNLRAFVIMAGFTAISTELKNPLIRSILYNRGFSSLYQSLSLAFSALPGIIAGLPKSKVLKTRGSSILSYLFDQSQALYEQFKGDHQKYPQVFIITGHVGQGKTTYTHELIEKLAMRGINVSGFLSVGIQEDEKRIGFDLVDISTGHRMVISRIFAQDGWIRYGHYYFDPAVFKKGGEMLLKSLEEGARLILIDEIGPLELGDSGWSFVIEQLCSKSSIPMIWVVRKSLVEKTARKWNVGDVFVYDIGEDQEDEALKVIHRMIDK